MQLFYEDCGRKTRARQRHYNRLLLLFTSTYTVLLAGTWRHNFHTINKEQTTLIDKGARLDLLGLYGVELGRPKESHETVQVTCTPEVPRWGDPRRLVSTAASVAAAAPRPCQGEVIRAPAGNALRGTNGSLLLF